MKQPAYIKIYHAIKKDIREGEYKPGDLLPAEHAIEHLFGVSRTTVRRALEMLVREGYVEATQGRGTTVLDFSTVQRLNALTSITETLKSKGLTVTTKGMHIDHVSANATVSRALKIPEGSIVIRIQRVQCANDVPICIMTNYLQESLVPGIEYFVGRFTSLYTFLENQYHIVLTCATENISAAVADFAEAQILQVPVGTPLLLSRRTTFTESGPAEHAIIKLLGNKYEYSIYTEGRP